MADNVRIEWVKALPAENGSVVGAKPMSYGDEAFDTLAASQSQVSSVAVPPGARFALITALSCDVVARVATAFGAETTGALCLNRAPRMLPVQGGTTINFKML